MLHYNRSGVVMGRGNSGRIVIEIDPLVKAQLYAALERDGMTLKNWLLRHTDTYLLESIQLGLRFPEPTSPRQRVPFSDEVPANSRQSFK